MTVRYFGFGRGPLLLCLVLLSCAAPDCEALRAKRLVKPSRAADMIPVLYKQNSAAQVGSFVGAYTKKCNDNDCNCNQECRRYRDMVKVSSAALKYTIQMEKQDQKTEKTIVARFNKMMQREDRHSKRRTQQIKQATVLRNKSKAERKGFKAMRKKIEGQFKAWKLSNKAKTKAAAAMMLRLRGGIAKVLAQARASMKSWVHGQQDKRRRHDRVFDKMNGDMTKLYLDTMKKVKGFKKACREEQRKQNVDMVNFQDYYRSIQRFDKKVTEKIFKRSIEAMRLAEKIRYVNGTQSAETKGLEDQAAAVENMELYLNKSMGMLQEMSMRVEAMKSSDEAGHQMIHQAHISYNGFLDTVAHLREKLRHRKIMMKSLLEGTELRVKRWSNDLRTYSHTRRDPDNRMAVRQLRAIINQLRPYMQEGEMKKGADDIRNFILDYEKQPAVAAIAQDLVDRVTFRVSEDVQRLAKGENASKFAMKEDSDEPMMDNNADYYQKTIEGYSKADADRLAGKKEPIEGKFKYKLPPMGDAPKDKPEPKPVKEGDSEEEEEEEDDSKKDSGEAAEKAAVAPDM